MRIYEPVSSWTLRRKWWVISAAFLLVVVTIPVYNQLGSEFMPPLEEGSILYMPTTMPGISITEAQKILQVTDRIIKQFPEVDRVLGKAGRAETSTDPAPLSMLETVITLKPKAQWRKVDTWYSAWAPDWTRPILRRLTSDTISQEDLDRPHERSPDRQWIVQCLDHADQGSDRNVEHRFAHTAGTQDLRGRSGHHRRNRGPGRIGSFPGQRDPQCLCRTHRQRLFY